jgi:hypothetical protein
MAFPRCAYEWLGAVIVVGAWWAEGLTPEKTAKNPYCPKCQHPPPMRVVGRNTPQQQELFA